MGILLFVRCIRYVIIVTERVVCTRMRGEEEEEEEASLLFPSRFFRPPSLRLSPPYSLSHSSPPFLARPLEGPSRFLARSHRPYATECESFRVRLRATDYRNQPVPVPVYRPTNYNHRFERRHFLVFELIREDASLLPRGSTGKRIQRKTCHFIARCEPNFANRGDTSSTGRSWHAKLCHDDSRVEEGRNVSVT